MKLVDKIRAFVGGNEFPLDATINQSSALMLIWEHLGVWLEQEGFGYKKGSRTWRVTDIKTDILEFRFEAATRSENSALSQTYFTVSVGCYYSFFKSGFDQKLTHHIAGILTPTEEHCQLRFRLPSPNRKGKNRSEYSWALQKDLAPQQQTLSKLRDQLENIVLPKLDEFADLSKLVAFLQSDEAGYNVGKPSSLSRTYFLASTLFPMKHFEQARIQLLRAKKASDLLINKFSQHSSESEPIVLIRERDLIISMLAELKSDNTSPRIDQQNF